MSDVQTLISEARELILAGKIDEGEAKKNQAVALKALDDDIASKRLIPAATETAVKTDEPSIFAGAIKSAYVKKYGEPEGAVTQIMRELYGAYQAPDYYTLRAMKYADMERYCRFGVCDPALSRLVLYTPDQVIKAAMAGVGVTGNSSFKATMVEAQDQLGGFLVPEDMRTEMISRLPGLTVVRPLARTTPTSRDRLTFLRRTGGSSRYIGNVRVTMTDESPSAASETATNALFGQVEIPVHVCLANVPISKSLLEDTVVPLADELNEEFSTAAAILEDQQFLTGSGVKQPQGILNGTAANGSPFNSDVTTVNSGAASTLQADALVSAPWKLDGQYRQTTNNSTAWVAAKATYEAIAKFKDGNSRYLWNELNINLAAGTPDRLRGWQAKESEAMPAIAANTFPIIFGDFAGYRIVDRIGMSIERYSDSNTAATDSVIFYMRRRYGGQLVEGYRFVVVKIST